MTGGTDPAPRAVLEDSFLALPGEVADWRAVLLHAAAEEAGLLAALPGTVEELAAATACDPLAVGVALDALTAMGMVEGDGDGRYSATSTLPDAEAAAVTAHHARVIRQWAEGLGPALRGEAGLRQRTRRSPEELARWYDALATNARAQAPALVDACLSASSGVRTALDLGGGHGEYAAELARRGVAVTLQDLPASIDAVRDRPAITDNAVTLVPADVHEQVADGPFDLVLCAGVTHIFSADQNAALARRLADVVRPGGTVAISTFLRGVDPTAPLFAVQMLVVGNGDIHSRAAYEDWFTAAGFSGVTLAPVDGRPGRDLLIFRR